MKFNFACICGARWDGDVPPQTFVLLAGEWERCHRGEGHGDCSPRFAGRVRVKRTNRKQKIKQET